MINQLQIILLFFIDKQIGANKRLYVPFETIYDAAKDTYSRRKLSLALIGLTNAGYLENRDRSYRITESGFIFIEAYAISEEMSAENRKEIKKELKKELEEELKTRLGYQWLVIFIAFLAILMVVLLK